MEAAFVFSLDEEKVSERLVMFAAGDEILNDLRIIAMETNHILFSYTPPLSSYEIMNFMNSIAETDLSTSGREVYGRIKQRLSPKTFFSLGGAAFSVHLILKGEFSTRTNEQIAWVLPDLDRPDFLHIPFDLYFMDLVQLHFDPALQNYPGVRDDTSYINTNIPYMFDFLDGRLPFRAFAALGRNWWNIQIGRDRLSFGNAHTGNLLLSDTPDYYDFARFSVFNYWIKYSMVVSQVPFRFDQSFVDRSIVNFDDYPGIQTRSVDRYFYLHRIDLLLGKKFSLGITEQLITGDSPLQLRYLNPVMLMHNFFSGVDRPNWGDGKLGQMDNMLFGIDFQWMPIRNLSLYGQWIVDDLEMPLENDENTPNMVGYLIGIEYYHLFKKCAALFFIEFVYTDPYLYVDNSPLASSVWYRWAWNPASSSRYRWIGHPEGRDVIILMFGSHLSFGGKLFADTDIKYIIRGEHGIVWDWARGEQFRAESTPTGKPQHSITLCEKIEYKFSTSITIQGGIAGNIIFNADHKDITLYGAEISLGIKYIF